MVLKKLVLMKLDVTEEVFKPLKICKTDAKIKYINNLYLNNNLDPTYEELEIF